jgi:hypothetical protein
VESSGQRFQFGQHSSTGIPQNNIIPGNTVIAAKAGIRFPEHLSVDKPLDTRLRGYDVLFR